MSVRRATLRALGMGAAALLAASCDDGTSPPSDSELGVYLLTAVHGEPPPAIAFADATDTTTIISARLELMPDSVFAYDITIALSLSGERDTIGAFAEGPYGRDGELIWFTFQGYPFATTDTATYEDGVITVENPDGSLVFERVD